MPLSKTGMRRSLPATSSMPRSRSTQPSSRRRSLPWPTARIRNAATEHSRASLSLVSWPTTFNAARAGPAHRADVARDVASGRGFHLDDLGAHVLENLRAVGPEQHRGDVDHAHAVEMTGLDTLPCGASDDDQGDGTAVTRSAYAARSPS